MASEAVLLTLSLADFLCPTGTVLPGLMAVFDASSQLAMESRIPERQVVSERVKAALFWES